MAVKTITRKKTHETVREELLNSLKKNDAVEEPWLNIANLIDTGGAITIIHRYEETIKTRNKKTIGFVAKQTQILKKFKDTEEFLENVRQSPYMVVYMVEYKVVLYKFFKKFPALRNFTLSSPYFKNNLKMSKTVCKINAEFFS